MPQFEQYPGESDSDAQKRISQNKKNSKKNSVYSMREAKEYQGILKELNLYDGKIDGDFGEKSQKADSTFKVLKGKKYTNSQIFRHTIGAPHMPDEDWGLYMKYGKDYKKYKKPAQIEDTVIDSMKKSY